VLLGERELISRIFFSSVVSTKGRGFSVVPSLLDEKVFSLRGLVRGLVDADRAKFARILFLFFVCVLFFV
jgi:hypothetical protein